MGHHREERRDNQSPLAQAVVSESVERTYFLYSGLTLAAGAWPIFVRTRWPRPSGHRSPNENVETEIVAAENAFWRYALAVNFWF